MLYYTSLSFICLLEISKYGFNGSRRPQGARIRVYNCKSVLKFLMCVPVLSHWRGGYWLCCSGSTFLKERGEISFSFFVFHLLLFSFFIFNLVNICNHSLAGVGSVPPYPINELMIHFKIWFLELKYINGWQIKEKTHFFQEMFPNFVFWWWWWWRASSDTMVQNDRGHSISFTIIFILKTFSDPSCWMITQNNFGLICHDPSL